MIIDVARIFFSLFIFIINFEKKIWCEDFQFDLPKNATKQFPLI